MAAGALLLLLGACSLTGPGDTFVRTYAMGFTDFPYALTFDAALETWDVIARDGDLAVLHFDCGVPWQEALDGEPYPAAWQADLDFKRASLPAGHVVYVAVTPISESRDGLAHYRGDTPNEPLPPPWDGYTFDDPEVVAAFTAHCEYMIDFFSPDYFAYAIEANSLHWLAPEKWEAFVTLASAVYESLKANHPGLPVFVTLQADAYHDFPSSQGAAIADILPYTDLVAVSGYPFADGLSDPEALRRDYFFALADLAPEKPFAVAETAWPAEDVGFPYWYDIPADQETQLGYVERLLDDCDEAGAVFVCWFFSRDYDELWEDYFQFEPNAAAYRLWRDTGLYDGDGNARQALGYWLLALERPLSYRTSTSLRPSRASGVLSLTK